jgi:hypothetical protein
MNEARAISAYDQCLSLYLVFNLQLFCNLAIVPVLPRAKSARLA